MTTAKEKNGVMLLPTGEIREPKSAHLPFLIAVMVLLVSIGLTNLYSATNGGEYFFNQLKHVGFGVIAFFFFGWVIRPRHIRAYAYLGFVLLCFVLLLVPIMGSVASGAQRWLAFGPIRLQPSEFAKVVLPVIVARYFLSHKNISPYTLKELWPIILMILVVFGLIFQQPDLGTAGFCLLVVAVQICFVRLDVKTLGFTAMVALIIGILGWTVFLHDYQKLRILNLLNPQLDPYGSGYSSVQSLVAVGSGAVFGKGYLHGTQTQLQFLTARHTDFVFSVFAEEHGFWGCVIVFLLFAGLVYIGLGIARQAHDTFSSLLAVGISVSLFLGFVLNIAMVLGMFPVVGIPLPFFSFGGSALIVIFIQLGLLVSVDRDSL